MTDPRLVAGLDLGSTGVKVLVADQDGHEVLVCQRPTPWLDGDSGTTTMDANTLAQTVRSLLGDAADLLVERRGAGASIASIALSGMGETGFLVDEHGHAVTSGFAWFDPRGREQVDRLPEPLRHEFAGRTGLPLGAQVSVAKLLHLRDGGTELAGRRWLNVPEFVATVLGVDPVTERSLASRTGLIDLDTGAPWPELLDHLGVTADFLPRLVDAGTVLGAVSDATVAAPFHGALVTVAGHDHLVSAVSGGRFDATSYHVSMGTAEVLLRAVDGPLTADARTRLADHLINCVRHVVPGQHVLVAGVKTGLLMRRVLRLSGVSDRAGRDLLDELAMSTPLQGVLADGAVEVTGARNDDGVLGLTVRADGVDPGELFNAVLRHGNEEIRLLIEAMDREVPPARSALLTGGWAEMASVQRARAAVLPAVTVSARSQDTAYGAAMFALRLLPAQHDEATAVAV